MSTEPTKQVPACPHCGITGEDLKLLCWGWQAFGAPQHFDTAEEPGVWSEADDFFEEGEFHCAYTVLTCGVCKKHVAIEEDGSLVKATVKPIDWND